MILMLVVDYLALNTASKSCMFIHLFTNLNLKKKFFLEEKNYKLVKKIIIKETKERALKFKLREYVADFQIQFRRWIFSKECLENFMISHYFLRF